LDAQQRRRGFVVDLQGRVVELKIVERPLDASSGLVAVAVGVDEDVRGEAGNPEVTSQTCRSWTSRTPWWPAIARPIFSGSRPAGAASRNTRPDALSSE
jgi:hypothetical protein